MARIIINQVSDDWVEISVGPEIIYSGHKLPDTPEAFVDVFNTLVNCITPNIEIISYEDYPDPEQDEY
jgi:hypothetical protein